MSVEFYNIIIDLARITSYYKREIRTKEYSWYGDIENAKSERYLSLFETYKLRAAMFARSDEGPAMMDRVCSSDWYLRPRSLEDKYCSYYVDFLRNLADAEERKLVLENLHKNAVSPFITRMLNPPAS